MMTANHALPVLRSLHSGQRMDSEWRHRTIVSIGVHLGRRLYRVLGRQRALPSGIADLLQLAREIHALFRDDATAP
jgi:hypothetical protein